MEKEATLLGKATSEYGIEVVIPDKEIFQERSCQVLFFKNF